MLQSTTVDFYARTVIYLKVLGFRAITIVNGKSVTKPIDLLFFLFGLYLGGAICYLTVINKEKFASSQSEIANQGNFISVIASICVSVISMIFAFIFRHRLWGIILNFAGVDEKVKSNLSVLFDVLVNQISILV
jgi:hypothetical protein